MQMRSRTSLSEEGYVVLPVMVKQGDKFVPTYPTDRDQYTHPLIYKTMEDVNNGRNRPLSPCMSGRVTSSPVFHQQLYNPPGFRSPINVPPSSLLLYARSMCLPTVASHDKIFFSHIQKQRQKLVGEFSSLNFLYELREVGSLFKDHAGRWRKLNSYRPIDYLFGVRPMISDLLAAMRHYNSICDRYADVLKKFTSYPVYRGKRAIETATGEISFFTGNVHFQDDNIRVRSILKGTLSLGVPWLAQLNPELFMLLEQAAIDPSASNAWNALPFSWLVDWFLPFGDYLASLPSLMKPECYFRGTISHKLLGHHVTETRYSGPGFTFSNGQTGSSFATASYTRTVFNGPTTGLISWDMTQGLNSIERMAIIRDIFEPNGSKLKSKGPG